MIFLVFILGILGKNRLIYISAGVLLVFSLLGLMPKSVTAQKVILDVGVIFLLIGVLIPFSFRHFNIQNLYSGLFSLIGLIAFIVGIASSVMARSGVNLMQEHPEVTISLLFGTIVGTTFFEGIPVGPLVAAGLAAYIIMFFNRF